jgi:hypothetical protein
VSPPVVTAADLDPSGKSPHDPGAKLDYGKNRLGLVLLGFPNALKAVGQVGTYGANKYSDNGWKSVPNGQERYTDALLRHEVEFACGESDDTESGLPHLAHAAWNALAVLELYLTGNGK